MMKRACSPQSSRVQSTSQKCGLRNCGSVLTSILYQNRAKMKGIPLTGNLFYWRGSESNEVGPLTPCREGI